MKDPARKTPSQPFENLAQEVAENNGFGHWQEDVTTRDIATAPDLLTAAWRMNRIIGDAQQGLDLIVRELGRKPSRKRQATRESREKRGEF